MARTSSGFSESARRKPALLIAASRYSEGSSIIALATSALPMFRNTSAHVPAFSRCPRKLKVTPFIWVETSMSLAEKRLPLSAFLASSPSVCSTSSSCWSVKPLSNHAERPTPAHRTKHLPKLRGVRPHLGTCLHAARAMWERWRPTVRQLGPCQLRQEEQPGRYDWRT